ncbi:MAG: YfhO family protein [Clostridiales bacterium]|nr:YfhO family protein [Clostridiales bacterium]
MDKVKKYYFILIPPILTAALLLFEFYKGALYPFGTGSITWCDMSQVFVPLLMGYKDLLAGKASLFFSFSNAGGMNYYGLFFFYLASPFNLLLGAVDKQEVVLWVNILVLLKLAFSSLTACIYLSFSHRNLTSLECIALSLVYSFCGYGLMFYQNIMWLDNMILFPLFMLSIDRLIKEKKNTMYIVLLSLIIICNFYTSYMIILFALVFFGVYLHYHKNSDNGVVCARLISGTLISLLLTAFVYIPCYIQTLHSSRFEDTVISAVGTTHFLANYTTSIPVLLCSASVFTIMLINVFLNKEQTKDSKSALIVCLLSLIPIFIEPVNLIWHAGGYMSFPARYGFISIFMVIRYCAVCLSSRTNRSEKTQKTGPLMLALFTGLLYAILTPQFFEHYGNDLTQYTLSLWGNNESLDRTTELFCFGLICYGVIYILYRKDLISRTSFAALLLVLIILESSLNIRMYMISAYTKNPSNAEHYTSIAEIADKIDDSSFYRVNTDDKITDNNMIGALGYNSLSHYTSLNNEDYIVNQKRLGYSSVWMETGSYGGTDFTDALYSVKYKIIRGTPSEDSVFSNDQYSIEPTDHYLGLGIITCSDLSDSTYIPDDLSRSEVQRYLFRKLYYVDPVTDYQFDHNDGINYSDNTYHIAEGTHITYHIHVSGEQTLYADCFNTYGSHLSEDYYDSLTIAVNGNEIRSNYPSGHDNGLCRLGIFNDEDVVIDLFCKKSVNVRSFGVFGFDNSLLAAAISNTQTADLNYENGKITGQCSCDNPSSCILAVPYQEGFTVKVNGHKVDHSRIFSDFISFPLEKGDNTIVITYRPQGFDLAVSISLIGVVLLILYIFKGSKISYPQKIYDLSLITVRIVTAAALIVIYLLPVILNFLYMRH